MTTIVERLDQIFKEKDIPVTKELVHDNTLALYTISFELKKTHVLPLEIILENDKEQSDIQITYRQVSQLTKYDKRFELLEVLNELNGVKVGYYTLFLAADGEVYLRSMLRCHEDVSAFYDMMIQGPAIVKSFIDDIQKITGPFSNVTGL